MPSSSSSESSSSSSAEREMVFPMHKNVGKMVKHSSMQQNKQLAERILSAMASQSSRDTLFSGHSHQGLFQGDGHDVSLKQEHQSVERHAKNCRRFEPYPTYSHMKSRSEQGNAAEARLESPKKSQHDVEKLCRLGRRNYVAILLQSADIVTILEKASQSNETLQMCLSERGIVDGLKDVHVTLAHQRSHGVPAVAEYSVLCGSSAQVEIKSLLFSERVAALEVEIQSSSGLQIVSKNSWPHITVWTAEGVHPREANILPNLVVKGEASRLDFLETFLVTGIVKLL